METVGLIVTLVIVAVVLSIGVVALAAPLLLGRTPHVHLRPTEVVIKHEAAALRLDFVNYRNGHLFLTSQRLLWVPIGFPALQREMDPIEHSLNEVRDAGRADAYWWWRHPLLIRSWDDRWEYWTGMGLRDGSVEHWISEINRLAKAART